MSLYCSVLFEFKAARTGLHLRVDYCFSVFTLRFNFLLMYVSFIRFIMVPSGNMGVFDPTEIHNRGQLKSHMKEAMIKLGFYLLCFFMYLYR